MSHLTRLLATTLITASLITLYGPSAEANVSTDSYRPCKPSQGIDLLLMMDESGSLNGPNGADPNGIQRTQALKLIRDYLSLEPEIRVALVGFDTEAKLHMPNFAQASNRHPSDQIIEESIGEQGDTNYAVALDAALNAFENITSGTNRENRCRVLVFFTDGIYDPVDGTATAGDEEDKARTLRSETCSPDDRSSYKNKFLDLGIQTYAVLLGDSFQTGIQSADEHAKLMATVSMQVIRAITGHGSSPLVADVAQDPLCSQWSDKQTGEIITVASIDDFANKLLEVVKTSTQLLKWPDCDSENDGRTIRSEHLPAGAYINEIWISASNGTIDSYEILDQDGGSISLPGQPEVRSTRIQFDHRHLKELEAGWTLQLTVSSSPGETTTLSCLAGRVSTPLQLDGRVFDETGRSVDTLLDNRGYWLRVDLGSYPCPIKADSFTLKSVSAPSSPELSNEACSRGKRTVVFDYLPSPNIDTSESVQNFEGFLEPEFATNLFPATEVKFPAHVHVGFEVLVTSDNAPRLDCDGPSTITNVSGSFPGQIVAREDCTVIPPLEGTATVDVSWSSATVPGLEWSPIPSAMPTLQPGDDPFIFNLESEQLPKDSRPSIDGTVRVTVGWQPPGGSTQPPVDESVRVNIERLDATHTGGDSLLSCTDSHVTVAKTAVKVPQQPIKGAAGCVLEPPRWGSVTVATTWEGPPDAPGPIDWQFDQSPGDSGTLSSNGQELTLDADEAAVSLDFATTDELENRRWDLTGTIRLVATWDSLIGGSLQAGDVTLPATLDFDAHDNLICPGSRQVSIANADIEVPRDTAVKATSGCELRPPRWGSITVATTWEGPPDAPGPIDWQFDQSPGDSGTLSSNGQELTLDADEAAVSLDFATTDELENRRWDLTGTIRLVATWDPDSGGDPTSTEVTLSVPLDLKGRSNSALAFWLTVLFTVIAVVVTYGGLYAILVYANQLPSRHNFFSSTWETTLERSPNGRLQIPKGESYQPTVEDLSLIAGDDKHNRWLRAGDLKIKASHARFWNLNGLLAGGWGQLSHVGRITQATPAGRYPGTTRILFDRLVVVAIETGMDPENPKAAVHFLVPNLGPSSGVDGISALTNNAPKIINDLTDRYDHFVREHQDGDHEDNDYSPSSGPPPPPQADKPPSSGPPPPPQADKPPSSGPPPPPPTH